MVFLDKKSKEIKITTFSVIRGPTLLISDDLIYKSKNSVVHVLPARFNSVHETDCL